MKLGSVFVTAVLAAGAAASWLSAPGTQPLIPLPLIFSHFPQLPPLTHTPAYNKWHETELERWLTDHDIPHPSPATRSDLESLVQQNWDAHVASPYTSWSAPQLRSYLQSKGHDASAYAGDTQEALLRKVKGSWYETEDKSGQAWGDVKGWMFDTWSDSQLKAFCDKKGIAVPQPRTRDAMLAKIRANYETTAKKAGETAAYPGDWLYDSWSSKESTALHALLFKANGFAESDLKAWLEENGFDVPHTNKVSPPNNNNNKFQCKTRD